MHFCNGLGGLGFWYQLDVHMVLAVECSVSRGNGRSELARIQVLVVIHLVPDRVFGRDRVVAGMGDWWSVYVRGGLKCVFDSVIGDH